MYNNSDNNAVRSEPVDFQLKLPMFNFSPNMYMCDSMNSFMSPEPSQFLIPNWESTDYIPFPPLFNNDEYAPSKISKLESNQRNGKPTSLTLPNFAQNTASNMTVNIPPKLHYTPPFQIPFPSISINLISSNKNQKSPTEIAPLINIGKNKCLANKKRRIKNLECMHCYKLFATKYELTRHIRVHTNERPFKCPVCNNGFKQKVHMRTHKKAIHSSYLRPFECDVCKKRFKEKGALTKHIKYMHQTARQMFDCRVCHKSFKRKGNLKTHLKRCGVGNRK